MPLLTEGNTTVLFVAANVTEQVIGPLLEGREFQVTIAGNIKGFDGVNTSICVSTDEGGISFVLLACTKLKFMHIIPSC